MIFGIEQKVNNNSQRSLVSFITRKFSWILYNNSILKFKRGAYGFESSISSICDLNIWRIAVSLFLRMWKEKKKKMFEFYLDFLLCHSDVCCQKRHTQCIWMSAGFESIFKRCWLFFVFVYLLKNIGHRVLLFFSREKRPKLANPKFVTRRLDSSCLLCILRSAGLKWHSFGINKIESSLCKFFIAGG